MRLTIGLAVGLVLSFAAAGAGPVSAEGVEQGRQITERLCSRCHAVGREGESPHKDAPPFRTFGNDWPVESLEEALAEGITVGHPDMPEFVLDPDEIASLIAYLASLR